jgi:hypothetical protein
MKPLYILICMIFLFTIGFVNAIGTSPAVDPNMVLYYKFNLTDHNSTTINDSSLYNNYGLLSNTLFQSKGIMNGMYGKKRTLESIKNRGTQ